MNGYRWFVSGALALALATCCVSKASATILYDNGPPDQLNGHEATFWVQAEDFILPGAGLLTDVHFWTAETNDAWDGTLTFYLFNNVNSPGPQPANTPFVTGAAANVSRVATGNTSNGLPEYAYSFDLPTPVNLLGGTRYWLGLHLANDFSTPSGVYWETTTTPVGAAGMDAFGGNFNSWNSNFGEHAFYLTTPEPGTVVLAGWALGAMLLWARRQRGRSDEV